MDKKVTSAITLLRYENNLRWSEIACLLPVYIKGTRNDFHHQLTRSGIEGSEGIDVVDIKCNSHQMVTVSVVERVLEYIGIDQKLHG